jgi:alpha-methylacyl-CoA racemase
MQPLAGLKVVELHAIGPVPFAGYLLAQYGAKVIRVSPPADPGLGVEVAPAFDLLNSNKEALTLDLKSAEALGEIERLLANADVLLEGFRPGVLKRLGLNPEALRLRHPRLVIGRLSGWGEHGILAPRAGHDINYLAVSGILHAIGSAETPEIPLNLIGDFGGGTMHLLVGVLAALLRRSLTGEGMVVSTSILAASLGLTPMLYGLLAAGVWTLRRRDNILDGAAPYYRVYRCSDGKHVAVGAIEGRFYRALLELTGLRGQLDPAHQNNRAQWPQAIAAFTRVFATRDRDSWAREAEQCDCCLAPVLDLIEASHYPHNLDNRLFQRHTSRPSAIQANTPSTADPPAHAGQLPANAYVRPEPVLRFRH